MPSSVDPSSNHPAIHLNDQGEPKQDAEKREVGNCLSKVLSLDEDGMNDSMP